MINFTDLIKNQISTFGVMTAAGILISLLWQIKACALSSKRQILSKKPIKIIIEITYWMSTAYILTSFLYYCAYGKVSFHAAAGFLAGLLLCRKIWCGIIK